MKTETHLLHCPFCGCDTAHTVEQINDFYSVECANCGATTAMTDKDNAPILWNRRKPAVFNFVYLVYRVADNGVCLMDIFRHYDDAEAFINMREYYDKTYRYSYYISKAVVN